jgi:hypothetical protein
LYDADFTQLAFFQQPGNVVLDLAFTQSEIAVLTSAPAIVKLDFGLNQISTTPLSGHNQTFTSVAFADGGFVVGGGEQYGSNGHENQSAFIKEFKNDGATSSTNADAALVEVSQIGSIQVEDFNWIYRATIPNISVTVKNNSPSVINSLNINVSFPIDNVFLSECLYLQAFFKSFDNLNLQPNASMQLTWGDQEVWFSSNPTGEQLELCLWTSLPNHHLETNNDNDVSCTELLISSAREPQPLAFRHYFNAESDELVLEIEPGFELEKSAAFIFNAAGQLLRKTPIAEQRQVLELRDLADGAYFLQVVSGERVGWGRFVKY